MSDPVVSLYIDNLTIWYPPASVMDSITSTLGGTTHLILAFYLPGSGPTDLAEALVNGTLPDDAVDTLHGLGVTVLVSAGGGTVTPISSGVDATSFGTEVATWALQQGLDGVDLDIEDQQAFLDDPSTAIQWMVDITNAIAKTYSAQGKTAVITHAPQAPYFSPDFGNAPYLQVDAQVGDLIDFYNVQFYNQDTSTYDTYESLFVQSNGWASQSSVSEIVAAGVPSSRIAVGKPVEDGDQANTGYVAISDLVSFFQKAVDKGIAFRGAMGWQDHTDDATSSWTTQLAQAMT